VKQVSPQLKRDRYKGGRSTTLNLVSCILSRTTIVREEHCIAERRKERRAGWPHATGAIAGKFLLVAFLLFTIHYSLFTVCPPNAYADGPFDAIKKTYSAITSLEATFQQRIFISSLKRDRDFSGEFIYKRQRGFLWQYRKPKARYFLYDGRFIWQGEEEKAYIVKERVNREKTGGTFLDLVEDIAAMDTLFNLKGESREGDLTLLELTPKKEGMINLAKVWIDSRNLVRKIEIYEFTGNVNHIEFSQVRINGPIDEGRLAFRPEKGKEIVER
jgi:outer membrane lipoprotein-sorting protein